VPAVKCPWLCHGNRREEGRGRREEGAGCHVGRGCATVTGRDGHGYKAARARRRHGIVYDEKRGPLFEQ